MKVGVAILVAQRHKKERILYILYLLMIIREKGVITHAYKKKGWSSYIPQEGPPYNCPTRGTIHSHTIPTTTPLHCPPLSETPSSILTSKTGLPKHFNSDSTHNIFHNKHTLPSPLTHNTLPSLSQHTSAVFNLVSLHLPFHCLRLNSCLLRHCHL
jgi:hypothetical protein